MLSVDEINKLQEENKRLKAEVETRDNLVEHFRKEAINWAKISNDCIKDIENYKQTLQEIKAIARKLKSPHCTDCTQVLNKKGKCTGECMYDYKKIILDLITEAEEE